MIIHRTGIDAQIRRCTWGGGKEEGERTALPSALERLPRLIGVRLTTGRAIRGTDLKIGQGWRWMDGTVCILVFVTTPLKRVSLYRMGVVLFII